MALIRQLRDNRPGLPVVVVTGTPPEGGLAEIQDSDPGRTVLLIKPTSVADLTGALRTVLGEA